MNATILKLKENPLELFLNNLDSTGSQKIYQFELKRFFNFVGKGLSEIEPLDVLKFKSSLSANKPTTKNGKLSII